MIAPVLDQERKRRALRLIQLHLSIHLTLKRTKDLHVPGEYRAACFCTG